MDKEAVEKELDCLTCGYGYWYYPDVGASDCVCQHPSNPSGMGGCPLAKDIYLVKQMARVGTCPKYLTGRGYAN